ncbi:hypothetical protein FS749_002879 [Ceratobasidium sp. UAMH 11750]|nr:hypothetical protein FS749_002879 [Ceratobasidium sp. UAMH 11750]
MVPTAKAMKSFLAKLHRDQKDWRQESQLSLLPEATQDQSAVAPGTYQIRALHGFSIWEGDKLVKITPKTTVQQLKKYTIYASCASLNGPAYYLVMAGEWEVDYPLLEKQSLRLTGLQKACIDKHPRFRGSTKWITMRTVNAIYYMLQPEVIYEGMWTESVGEWSGTRPAQGANLHYFDVDPNQPRPDFWGGLASWKAFRRWYEAENMVTIEDGNESARPNDADDDLEESDEAEASREDDGKDEGVGEDDDGRGEEEHQEAGGRSSSSEGVGKSGGDRGAARRRRAREREARQKSAGPQGSGKGKERTDERGESKKLGQGKTKGMDKAKEKVKEKLRAKVAGRVQGRSATDQGQQKEEVELEANAPRKRRASPPDEAAPVPSSSKRAALAIPALLADSPPPGSETVLDLNPPTSDFPPSASAGTGSTEVHAPAQSVGHHATANVPPLPTHLPGLWSLEKTADKSSRTTSPPPPLRLERITPLMPLSSLPRSFSPEIASCGQIPAEPGARLEVLSQLMCGSSSVGASTASPFSSHPSGLAAMSASQGSAGHEPLTYLQDLCAPQGDTSVGPIDFSVLGDMQDGSMWAFLNPDMYPQLAAFVGGDMGASGAEELAFESVVNADYPAYDGYWDMVEDPQPPADALPDPHTFPPDTQL